MSYKCPFCQRSFTKLYGLATHIVQKHAFSGDPICPACNRRFANLQGLKCHVTKNVHDPEHAKYYLLFATRRRGQRKLRLREWYEQLTSSSSGCSSQCSATL